jgi:hypothetical protein
MRRLLGGIFMVTSALLLAAGVAIVLIGERRKPRLRNSERPFSIKRTKSEVGYVYWILKGRGKYKCYILCDSWQEAVAEANRRLQSETEDRAEFAFARS